ncbi:TetR/AcrR family transcriptional regulator C-terminal domain-containing protein [Nocardia sp. NPDC050712]|uniref:TetR/AcrR family transcriptional regulator C-terminal domain-containing protein n=1 Tax=Nocardia sp. NPDC050712 TaxID=3155518 RepID=UPI0034089FF5
MTKQFSSVFLREPRPAKTAGLGRDQIVRAAIELLDAEGTPALSMRKLGAKLGSGATSLYWYVANKEQLHELVLDEFWGMVELPESDEAPWREVLTTFGYNLRATMYAHPWSTELIGAIPSLGPNAFGTTDRLRRAFVQAGFSGIDIYMASGTVMCFVLGQVIPELAFRKAYGSDQIDPESGISEHMAEFAKGYPEMLVEYREQVEIEPATARAMAFDFGLLCVLDGLEARLRKAHEL